MIFVLKTHSHLSNMIRQPLFNEFLMLICCFGLTLIWQSTFSQYTTCTHTPSLTQPASHCLSIDPKSQAHPNYKM